MNKPTTSEQLRLTEDAYDRMYKLQCEWQNRAEKAEATIKAIGKLPDKWIDESTDYFPAGKEVAMNCANKLQALLKQEVKS